MHKICHAWDVRVCQRFITLCKGESYHTQAPSLHDGQAEKQDISSLLHLFKFRQITSYLFHFTFNSVENYVFPGG